MCTSCDLQEPELSLKRIAASALSDISKHSPELAQTVVDAGAIAHLAQMILNPDAKLKVGDLNHGVVSAANILSTQYEVIAASTANCSSDLGPFNCYVMPKCISHK